MKTLFRSTAVAIFAAAACIAAASTTPAAASPQEGLTQDLSARCRTVVSTRWHNGRRVTSSRRVCSAPAYAAGCRTVVKSRWSNGRRITVRSRVC